MRYLMLDRPEREALLERLTAMPEWVEEVFGRLPAERAARKAKDGGFAPVEQCWHLADLEREAFAERLRRLRDEDEPLLADFDGDRMAAERRYLGLTASEAIAAFAAARARNVALLREVRPEEWNRSGQQEGVGPVMLCDLPVMMAEHDRAHRAEIEAWIASDAAGAGRGD
jgi:DinB superfamily